MITPFTDPWVDNIVIVTRLVMVREIEMGKDETANTNYHPAACT